MYAIISTGGKQLKVTNDEVVAVERLAGNAGDKITFDQVLAVGEGANMNFGSSWKARKWKRRSSNTSADRN